jgi:hypothetical protein
VVDRKRVAAPSSHHKERGMWLRSDAVLGWLSMARARLFGLEVSGQKNLHGSCASMMTRALHEMVTESRHVAVVP